MCTEWPVDPGCAYSVTPWYLCPRSGLANNQCWSLVLQRRNSTGDTEEHSYETVVVDAAAADSKCCRTGLPWSTMLPQGLVRADQSWHVHPAILQRPADAAPVQITSSGLIWKACPAREVSGA
jgi:hypothetical protein